MAARHLRHQVGGGGRDDDQVRLAGEPDMADILLGFAVEQVRVDRAAGERAGRERRDELGRAAGHDDAHRGAALLQPADQVEAFVGCDAARYDEQDALAPKRRVNIRHDASPLDLARRCAGSGEHIPG